MHTTPLLYSALIVALALTTGCQSWQGASFPMQNATRVPPPGTGTYQVPSGYYNGANTSSLNPASQTMQASNSPPASFHSASNMNAGSSGNGGLSNSGPGINSPGINSPGINSPGINSTAGGGVVQAAFQSSPPSASVAPARLSDSNSSANSLGNGNAASSGDVPATETPSLQWQQFDGR